MIEKKKFQKTELVLGGLAGVCAGFFTNPLEVVKIRMQLQGELQSKGNYTRHYKNVFHAAYTIGTKDGILALQKGLGPALIFQFLMNGTRLGIYSWGDSKGFTRQKSGGISTFGSIILASSAGALSCLVSSPLLLVKTHLQSRANEKSIAVGYQHKESKLLASLGAIYRTQGLKGLWRGTFTSMPRFIVGSAVQLPTFTISLQYIKKKGQFKEGSWLAPFFASLFSGIFVSLSMAPWDLLSTRFYNQGVDSKGKGLLYNSIYDCGYKISRKEGFLGFYKGWTANYFRIGPQTLLCLVFWDQLKYYHGKYKLLNM